MGFKLKVTPLASENIKNAMQFYSSVASSNIARKFMQDYIQTVDVIQQSPYFKIYYKDFRGLPLRKFPFIIFYQVNVEQSQILIKAVFNTNQNPSKYPK
jgi:toxin ParE1/3/4